MQLFVVLAYSCILIFSVSCLRVKNSKNRYASIYIWTFHASSTAFSPFSCLWIMLLVETRVRLMMVFEGQCRYFLIKAADNCIYWEPVTVDLTIFMLKIRTKIGSTQFYPFIHFRMEKPLQQHSNHYERLKLSTETHHHLYICG